MLNSSRQNKTFNTDVLLAKVSAQGQAKPAQNLTKLNKFCCRMMIKDDMSKPDIQKCVAAGNALVLSTGTLRGVLRVLDMRETFLSPMKKGSTLNTALKYGSKFDQTSDASCFTLRRCRCFTSRSKAATTNCPVVSPDSFSCSTALATSWGTRAAIVCDFAFTDFVAITESQCVRCLTVWQKKDGCKHLTCSTPVTNMVFNTLSTGVAQKPKPGSASTLSGPLTTNVIASNEVAMFDNTTPVSGRIPLGSEKFQFRFMALLRSDSAAKPCRISIEATTEQEARRALAPLFILSLAARVPVQEACNV